MESISREDKISLMNKFDKKVLNKFIESIAHSEKKAIKVAKCEVESLLNEMCLEIFDLNKMYGTMIKWKHNYLMSLKSDYYSVLRFSNNYWFDKLLGDEKERFARIALDYYDNYLKNRYLKVGDYIENLSNEVYICLKAEGIYNSLNTVIEKINSNYNGSLKFPLIESFEIEVFNSLEQKINTSKNMFKEISIKNHQLMSENRRREREISTLESELSNNKNYSDILLNSINRKDYTPVKQFNDLLWGDNYPSLKVLFDFLQKNKVIDCGWSYFTDLLSESNSEIMNLQTEVINKGDIGYLLFKIKLFFKQRHRNTKKSYNEILKRKFFINNTPLDDTYMLNYIRGKKAINNSSKFKEIINELCINISSRYK